MSLEEHQQEFLASHGLVHGWDALLFTAAIMFIAVCSGTALFLDEGLGYDLPFWLRNAATWILGIGVVAWLAAVSLSIVDMTRIDIARTAAIEGLQSAREVRGGHNQIMLSCYKEHDYKGRLCDIANWLTFLAPVLGMAAADWFAWGTIYVAGFGCHKFFTCCLKTEVRDYIQTLTPEIIAFMTGELEEHPHRTQLNRVVAAQTAMAAEQSAHEAAQAARAIDILDQSEPEPEPMTKPPHRYSRHIRLSRNNT